MKHTLFLYNFAKLFIPGSIVLLIIFIISHHIPQLIQKNLNQPQAINQLRETKIPNQTTSASPKKIERTIISDPDPPRASIKLVEPRLPQQPSAVVQKKEESLVAPETINASFFYIIALKSGGIMKAKEISMNEDILTIWVDDGYSVKISKNDIQKIDKHSL
ncbi:MAG: hypothetical protein KJ630_10585 [Proteobacteria bacterium]|nr:hypothetical protein [Pseudomonadota bacterium]